MSQLNDVESAASWRSYKNNRYATLGTRRILRLLRQHFRVHRHVMRREEDFQRYAWELFEELLDAGAIALLHCGVAEENERARIEQDNRRRRAKGEPLEPTPEEREAGLLEAEVLRGKLMARAYAEAEALAKKERRDRRQRQLALPCNLERRAAKRADTERGRLESELERAGAELEDASQRRENIAVDGELEHVDAPASLARKTA